MLQRWRLESLGVGPEVVGAARALARRSLAAWASWFVVCVFCGQPFIASLFFFKMAMKKRVHFFLREAVAAVYMLDARWRWRDEHARSCTEEI